MRQLFELPDRDFSERLSRIESHPVFEKLVGFGVVSLQRYPRPRSLAVSLPLEANASPVSDTSDLFGGDEELKRLIERMGERSFSACFLDDGTLTDAERAGICGISLADARRIRQLVDRLQIQQEFSKTESREAPKTHVQPIAGVELVEGQPALSFYHRDIWRGRYHVDEARRSQLPALLSTWESRQADDLLKQLQFVNRRTTGLYKAIECLLDLQADFLRTERRDHLKPLTLRGLGKLISMDSGCLHRLLQNRSLRLPSGREISLLALLPGRKAVLKDHLYDVLMAKPELKDEELAAELNSAFGLGICRRTVTIYRQELGILAYQQRKSSASLP